MLAALVAVTLAVQLDPYPPPIMPVPPPPPPRPFREETEQLEFSYGWDRYVQELAPLRTHLEAERDALLRTARQEATLVTSAEATRGQRYRYFRSWAAQDQAGPLQSYRSLTGQGREEYPPARFDGLIWSTETNRALTFSDVLGKDWPTRFRERFCAGLTEEHARGLGASVPRECPDLASTAPIPMDYDDDERFDTVDVLFGGWFPGDFYRISIPLTAADVAAAGSGYRAYLEARHRQ